MIDPRKGIPVSEEERTLLAMTGGLLHYLSALYLPAEYMPEMFRAPGWETVDVQGVPCYAVPDWRVFETKRRHVRMFSYHPVQFHIRLHEIDGVSLVQVLFACLDEWPEPYIAESIINPATDEHILTYLSKSPFITFNLYLNMEYQETRITDNPLREQAKQILQYLQDKNLKQNQIHDAFMAAKGKLESLVPLHYHGFEWSDQLRSMKLNFV